VAGHGVADRWRMLAALQDALQHFPRHGSTWAKERDEAVMWMALEILHDLKRSGRHTWGRGPVGDAVASRGGGMHRDRLLLNRIDTRDVDPRFRHLDLAREVDALKRRLFDAVFLRGAYVEQSWLVLRVLEIMHVHADRSVGGEELALWREAVGLGSLRLDVLQAPWTTRSLPELLAYYGIGKTVKGHRERGYRVRHWHVEALQRLRVEEGTIDLRSIPWMQGRYAWRESM